MKIDFIYSIIIKNVTYITKKVFGIPIFAIQKKK